MAKAVYVLLNNGAGALRGDDGDTILARIEHALAGTGREVEIARASGGELQRCLDDRLSRRPPEEVIVAGGDGTVSSAAASLCDTGIALGVLPLGTMNLFARSLAMPLDLDAALNALATAKPRTADLGEVNGRLFTHHVSMGLQARLVAMRERSNYGSRVGKILANLRALLTVVHRPPRLVLKATVDGSVLDLKTPALVVSNNVFGPNHLPYADALDHGVLGVYICSALRPGDVAQVTLEALLGTWHADGRVTTLTAKSVSVESRGKRKSISATVDGELVTFERAIEVSIRPASLVVLVPEPPTPA
jgi:diacylglycerol kinase family enzyme